MSTFAVKVGRRETGTKKKANEGTKRNSAKYYRSKNCYIKRSGKERRKEGKNHLVDLIDELSALMSVPNHYRVLLAELGRNTPVCGIMQLGGNQRSLEILTEIAETGAQVHYKTKIVRCTNVLLRIIDLLIMY